MGAEAKESVERVMVATPRKRKRSTVVVRDRLPPLSEGEIRLSVDGVGLSANNVFYASMGDAPLLRFFSVYPVPGRDDLVNVPAWGIGTVVASANPEIGVGERFRGFLHLSDVVQMKARRTRDGFAGAGKGRDRLVPAYNTFLAVDPAGPSPLAGSGAKADLALASAPSALSGYILYELLRSTDFYGAGGVALTSASSKLSLALAVHLAEDRRAGVLRQLTGYTSPAHAAFVASTGLFDEVLPYGAPLSAGEGLRHVLVDVAGDAAIYRQNARALVKGLAVGVTHASASASTYTAFGPSGLLKTVANMTGARSLASWVDRRLAPKLEMFFAPSVMRDLIARHGRAEFAARCDRGLQRFVDAAIDGGWIAVTRCEDTDAAQAAYQRVFDGTIPPSEAIVVALGGASSPAR